MNISWSRSEPLPSLKISASPSDKALCVVAALDCYIERTLIWRAINQASQLLVSFVKPHNAVAKSTVLGWVKQTLIMSGINTDIFKPVVQHPHYMQGSLVYKYQISLKENLGSIKLHGIGFTISLLWLFKKNFRKLLWIIKVLKKGVWGFGLQSCRIWSIQHWRIQHLIKIKGNKIRKLHKAANRL